jgi:hypothetical protein
MFRDSFDATLPVFALTGAAAFTELASADAGAGHQQRAVVSRRYC